MPNLSARQQSPSATSGEGCCEARFRNIQLRLPQNADYCLLAEMRRDTELQHLLMGYPSESVETDQEVSSWLERRINDPNCVFRIIADETDQVLGYAQIANIHRKGRYGSVGIALHRKNQGQGIGGQTLSAIFELAEKDLDLLKLLLEVRKDNIKAVNLYRRMMFREIGTLKDHYYDGRDFYDVLVMERRRAR